MTKIVLRFGDVDHDLVLAEYAVSAHDSIAGPMIDRLYERAKEFFCAVLSEEFGGFTPEELLTMPDERALVRLSDHFSARFFCQSLTLLYPEIRVELTILSTPRVFKEEGSWVMFWPDQRIRVRTTTWKFAMDVAADLTKNLW